MLKQKCGPKIQIWQYKMTKILLIENPSFELLSNYVEKHRKSNSDSLSK